MVANAQDAAGDRVRQVARQTADNRSSMLQDVDRGKHTEIDSITGHLIKVGLKHGLTLPLSEFVYYEIKHLEEQGIVDREGTE